MNDDFKAQITMVRNFPSHVGGYDAELPEQQCGESDYHGQCCFREGWACAVDAINRRLTEMQNKQI